MMNKTTYKFPIINKFVAHRKASMNWCKTYENHLKSFNHYCDINYSTEIEITQEMVDKWSEKRENENNNSRSSRIYVIIALVAYINYKNSTTLLAPKPTKHENYKYKPHIFKEQELIKFFNSCDSIEVVGNLMSTKLMQIIIPVLFRMMYSTGMRTLEMVYLKKEDVDLESGVVNIQKSKGYNQHIVVIHDSLKEMLVDYDRQIEKLIPNRDYFFPTKDNKGYQRSWVTVNFRKLWDNSNLEYARAYDFRHNYAIVNINSWHNVGVEFNSKILALSKSMGHSNIDSTMYYYTLVPGLADIQEELTRHTFEELIAEVEYEDD